MLKKFLAAATILLATASFGSPCSNSDITCYSDALPYVGANIGGLFPRWSLKDTSQATTNFSANGVYGGLFAGFGTMLDSNFYIAAEGFGNESYASSNTKTINSVGGPASDSLTMRYSYGGSIRPGIVFGGGMLGYLRIGVIRSRFNLHQTVVPFGATSNLSKNTVTGAQYGIGLQREISRNFSLRGEYDYSTYRSFRAFNNLIHAYNNTFGVGLVYLLS